MKDKEQTTHEAKSPSQTWANLVSGVKDAAVEAVYGDFTKHLVAHGSHEVAAALFNGSGFVMYPRGTHEDHAIDQAKQQERPQQAVEDRSRGDRGM